MKNRLLIKLCCIIAAGTVLLFWAIDILTNKAEQSMSTIADHNKQELYAMAEQAEHIYLHQGEAALEVWLEALKQKEQTWVGVATTKLIPLGNSDFTGQYEDGIWLGRSLEWMIHLYFESNPIMDIRFSNPDIHFLIQLPQRMRPGEYHPYADLAIQFALPLILLSLLSLVLYQHVMGPLRKLEDATKQFSQGNFDVRINSSDDTRNDELTALADTFDLMAERTSKLIASQRQLLSDLSHELRTPLTRMDMAVDFVEQELDTKQAIQRLRYESANMRGLVEDALTLAYLDTEKPKLNNDSFDVTELINVICEDARFEFPNRHLTISALEIAPITSSSQRALGQALENIIRNGLSYSPQGSEVCISLVLSQQRYIIEVKDSGPGVPDASLKKIFDPFFRVEHSRPRKHTSDPPSNLYKHQGFGLGLALAERQLASIDGDVWAQNEHDAHGTVCGLNLTVSFPVKRD
ncbi:MAG: sensor histidine kinase [Paraglaciecola sp.]|nr:sensor histidine kinase [Paraglaciecola sp.]